LGRGRASGARAVGWDIYGIMGMEKYVVTGLGGKAEGEGLRGWELRFRGVNWVY